MDRLELKSLQFRAFHGYYEKEKKRGNRFEVDIKIDADLSPAGCTDNLNKAINYEEICTVVRKVMRGPSHNLIESLAHEIGETLFHQFDQIQNLEVTIRKLNPPLAISCLYSEVTRSWQR